MTINTLARHLKLTENTIKNWIIKYKLPLGPHKEFSLDQLMDRMRRDYSLTLVKNLRLYLVQPANTPFYWLAGKVFREPHRAPVVRLISWKRWIAWITTEIDPIDQRKFIKIFFDFWVFWGGSEPRAGQKTLEAFGL